MIFQGYLGLAVLMVSYLQSLHVLQPILGKENVYSRGFQDRACPVELIRLSKTFLLMKTIGNHMVLE